MSLKIDPDTGDLELVDGDLVWLITDAQRADFMKQKIRSRLQFFLGEWFLNTAEGIPYYRDIFVKGVTLDDVRRIFRRAIASTPGVLRVTKLNVEKTGPRKASVTWAAQISDTLIVSDGPFVLSL